MKVGRLGMVAYIFLQPLSVDAISIIRGSSLPPLMQRTVISL